MEIKEYKTEIKYIDLTILIIVLISSLIIDYLYGLNFKIIGIIALYFIVRGVYVFYTSQVKRIIFVDNDFLILVKYDLFTPKKIKVDLNELSFFLDELFVYPNKFYILNFYVNKTKININKDYNLIAFPKHSIDEILAALEKLNVKKQIKT